MRMMKSASFASLSFAFIRLIAPHQALAQDHPLVGRFEGSTPMGRQVANYDETNIITAPIQEVGSTKQSGEGGSGSRARSIIFITSCPMAPPVWKRCATTKRA